ncbi:Putative tetR family transcriptional regulator [Nocardioides sp. PD653-B2]|nr:Putative tetR family transcriptional regulator [Nocardioides sp. PD653-B2]
MGVGLREQHKQTTRQALEDAALKRFARDGFDQTSVDAIAADAGVSPRTFFRYFATKDEVLDMGRAARQAMLRDTVRDLDLDPDLSVQDVVRQAVVALAVGFQDDRARVELRQRAAESSPVLRGRLFDTFVSWERTLAAALADRPGVDRDTAETLAAVGIAMFRTAIARWVRGPGSELPALVASAFGTLSSSPCPS